VKPEKVDFIEVESRIVVTSGWGEEKREKDGEKLMCR
jgi:hypothetical protein